MTRGATDASAGWREEYAHQHVAPGGVEARQTADSPPGRPSSGAGERVAAGNPGVPHTRRRGGRRRASRHGGEQ